MRKNHSFPKRMLLVVITFVAVMTMLAVNSENVQAQQWTGPDVNGNISNTNSGNVGVGTTSPDINARLHIYKATGAGVDIQAAGTGGWSRLRVFLREQTSSWFLWELNLPHAPYQKGFND